MKFLKRLKQFFITPFKPDTNQYIYTQHLTKGEAEALSKQIDESFEEFDRSMSNFMNNLEKALKERKR